MGQGHGQPLGGCRLGCQGYEGTEPVECLPEPQPRQEAVADDGGKSDEEEDSEEEEEEELEDAADEEREVPVQRREAPWYAQARSALVEPPPTTPGGAAATPKTWSSRGHSVSPRTSHTSLSLSTTASSVDSVSKTDAVVRQYYEARKSREKVLGFLLRNGYDNVNSKKRRLLKSSYPLHRAVKKNDPGMIRMLLEWGADFTQADSSRRTPHEYAQRRNHRGSHEEVLSILESAKEAGSTSRPGGVAAGMEANHGSQWETFLKQLASDPLVSRQRLATIAPQVAF